MKRLGLLRHAKSEEYEPQGRDFDRGLNEKGRRAAREIGRFIAADAPSFDLVIASPARRVQETLDLALGALGSQSPAAREEDRRLYLATADSIADVVAERGGKAENLLIAAHNPGLADFLLDRVPPSEDDTLRAEIERKYPTGAFTLLEFPTDDWAQIGSAPARLTMLKRPRDLDPSLGPELVR